MSIERVDIHMYNSEDIMVYVDEYPCMSVPGWVVGSINLWVYTYERLRMGICVESSSVH